jgi:hypothetical protein
MPRISASTFSAPEKCRMAIAGAVARTPEIAPESRGRWLGPGS